MNMTLTRNQLIDMYYRMWLIRYFDQNAMMLYHRGMIRGTTHAYIGEEAIAVSACAALRTDDYITSTHRGHGHCLAKGGDPNAMMAELMGKATGYCRGKGGSMHIADLDLGILGLAYFRYSNKYKNYDRRMVALGTLWNEVKQPERGYHSRGMFWGILWDYETETKDNYEKFSILKGLYKHVKRNGKVEKRRMLWFIPLPK